VRSACFSACFHASFALKLAVLRASMLLLCFSPLMTCVQREALL
jgi:hypothetical protein